MTNKNNHICKLKNIINYLNEKFEYICTPKNNIPLDEFLNEVLYKDYLLC